MNNIATTTAETLTTTAERVLSHPTNTTTAICVIVGLGLSALLISKAIDNGYNVQFDAKEGKLNFDKAVAR